MRAILFDHNPSSEYVEVSGDKLHHLLHVVRIGLQENLLLLTGTGIRTLTVVETISKKSLQLKVLGPVEAEKSHPVDIAIGIPKKEALESCLKESCELGIRNIFLIRSDYSQIKVPETERLQNLLVSGVEQSNAAYMPVIHNTEWHSLPWEDYEAIVLMNSQTSFEKSTFKTQGRVLLVVGPEGGFSPRELTYFQSIQKLKSIRLPTPILRTPTAVSAGVGFLLGTLLD